MVNKFLWKIKTYDALHEECEFGKIYEYVSCFEPLIHTTYGKWFQNYDLHGDEEH